MKYKIYQINKDHKERLFRRYNGYAKKSWYNEVYSGEVEPKSNVMATLEKLFFMFNIDNPSDFRGHSLSISDVIYLDGKYYYCDSLGFKEVTNFED